MNQKLTVDYTTEGEYIMTIGVSSSRGGVTYDIIITEDDYNNLKDMGIKENE